jgi:hypothetical protein
LAVQHDTAWKSDSFPGFGLRMTVQEVPCHRAAYVNPARDLVSTSPTPRHAVGVVHDMPPKKVECPGAGTALGAFLQVLPSQISPQARTGTVDELPAAMQNVLPRQATADRNADFGAPVAAQSRPFHDRAITVPLLAVPIATHPLGPPHETDFSPPTGVDSRGEADAGPAASAPVVTMTARTVAPSFIVRIAPSFGRVRIAPSFGRPTR